MRIFLFAYFVLWVFVGFAFRALADDYLEPSVEVWDNEGTYTVITPNEVGGYEGFDNRGRYLVIETPRSSGTIPLRDPFELAPREVTDQLLLPHERY